MVRYLSNILLFLKNYKYTILTMLYFCVITHWQIRQMSIYQNYYIINVFNTLSLVLYLHLFSRGKLRFLFLSIFALLITIDAYYGFVIEGVVSMGIISSILETNSNEAFAVSRSLFPGAVILLSITVFLVFMSANEFKKLKISRKYSAMLLVVYVFAGIPSFLILMTSGKFWYKPLFKDKPVLTAQYIVNNQFSLLYGTLSNVSAYFYEMHHIKNYLKDERTLPEGISLNLKNELPQKIYFVIGEAQYRQHMSIYGYPIKTTPFLDSLYQSSDNRLSVFHDAFSPAPLTRDALRMLLTFDTPQHSSSFTKYKNLIEMAKNAGYQTLWITGHNTINEGSLWESYAAYIARMADFYYFRWNEDLHLFSIVEKQNNPDAKQFFLINLTGSHAPYDNFDEFDKQQIHGEGTIADYDRTIHQTDRFIQKFYNMIKNDSSSVFVYISDHGEFLPNMGHGFLGKGSAQFEVPFYTVNCSKTDINGVVTKYIIPEKNKINTLSMTYILSELMGYYISKEQIEYVRQESDYIYHVDGKYYEFDKIELENEIIN